MAELITLSTHRSEAGSLTVYSNTLPGDIKRVFYIHGAGGARRGGHRHHKAWNVLICLVGRCRVYNHDGVEEQEFFLTHTDQCLVLEPRDWHIMDQFSDDAVLLVLSNEPYDLADYIDDPYPGASVRGIPAAHR